MNQTMIYGLIDPRNSELRYIGRASDVRGRLRGHLSIDLGHRNHKWNWIAGLKAVGLVPDVEVIESVPIGDAPAAERFWIAYFRSIGCALTNLTSGGEGRSGPLSPRERARLAVAAARGREGRVPTPETRARIAAALRGRPHSREAVAKMAAAKRGRPGRPHTPLARERISIARRAAVVAGRLTV